MTRKQSQKFEQLCADVHYIRHEIKVNGQSGLEPILVENHKINKELKDDVGDLKKRTTFLETINAKTASTYELWEASKKWAEQRRWVAAIFKVMFNKIMFRITLITIAIFGALLFGDRASALLWRIVHLIK